jgi:hypothetical protein
MEVVLVKVVLVIPIGSGQVNTNTVDIALVKNTNAGR